METRVPATRPSSARRRWILVGASICLFTLLLDSTAVALAIPTIRLDLGSSASGIQWVQSAYLLALAALVAPFGRLGAALGSRPALVAGLLLFAGGSVLAAGADTTAVLVAARAVQGAGGAALLASSVAVAGGVFRGRAALPLAAPVALGPVFGGAVVELASWRWLFWLNLPLAPLALATLAAAPESREESHWRRFAWPGLAALGAGLGLVVLALVQGQVWGWSSAGTLGSLAGGAALLVAFGWTAGRGSEQIGTRPLLGASAAAFALAGGYWTVMFLVPQYIDLVLRHSTPRTGVLMLPVTLPVVVLAPIAARLTPRLGAPLVLAGGMAFASAGVLVLTLVDQGSGTYELIAPGLVLFGIGLGIACVPLATSTPPAVAPGALAMAGSLGGALVLALAGAVFQHADVEKRISDGSFDAAFAAGLADAAWVLAAVLAACALLSWLLVRSADDARAGRRL